MFLRIHTVYEPSGVKIGYKIAIISTATTKILLDSGRNLPPLDCPYSYNHLELDGLTMGESEYDAVIITNYQVDRRGMIERINKEIPVYMSRDTKKVLDVIADHSSTKHQPWRT